MLVPYDPLEVASTNRRAITAVGIGNAVEWYDFAIYGALATVLGTVFFPGQSPSVQLLLAFAVYGTALLVRPLGALVFGQLGDTRGRQPAMTMVIVLMAVATAAVGLLPGYAAIGVTAPILLVLLRALQGLGGGGELGLSTVFLFENAPPRRRGAVGSLHITTLSLGMAFGMAVAALLFSVSGGAALRTGWWRAAFLLALPLGLIGWYVRHRVSETGDFVALQEVGALENRPWRSLWARHRRFLWRGFLIMGAGSLAYNTFFIFLPNHLIATEGTPLSTAWFISASALVVTAVSAAVLGHLSDRVGRRPVVGGSALALVVLGIPLVMIGGRSIGGLWIAQCLIGIAIGGVLSVAMLAEVFPPSLRSTGVALTAGLGTALVGATGPFVDQIVLETSGLAAAPGVYLAVIALAALVAVWGWNGRTTRRSRVPQDDPGSSVDAGGGQAHASRGQSEAAGSRVSDTELMQ